MSRAFLSKKVFLLAFIALTITTAAHADYTYTLDIPASRIWEVIAATEGPAVMSQMAANHQTYGIVNLYIAPVTAAEGGAGNLSTYSITSGATSGSNFNWHYVNYPNINNTFLPSQGLFSWYPTYSPGTVRNFLLLNSSIDAPWGYNVNYTSNNGFKIDNAPQNAHFSLTFTSPDANWNGSYHFLVEGNIYTNQFQNPAPAVTTNFTFFGPGGGLLQHDAGMGYTDAVPIPPSALMLMTGLFGLIGLGRMRKR